MSPPACGRCARRGDPDPRAAFLVGGVCRHRCVAKWEAAAPLERARRAGCGCCLSTNGGVRGGELRKGRAGAQLGRCLAEHQPRPEKVSSVHTHELVGKE